MLKKCRGLALSDELLERAVQFVKVNQQVAIHYWDDIEMDTVDMLTQLVRQEDPPEHSAESQAAAM